MDAWQLLADRMGYKDAKSAQSSVPRVLAGEHVESNRSDFDAVGWTDRLLVALDAVHLWRQLDDEPVSDVPPTDAEHDATCGGCGRMIDWSDPADLAVRIELGEMVHVRRRWCWWSLCALCFAESGLRQPRAGRIPDAVLLDLYRTYVRDRVGLERLVETERLPERFGFRTVGGAASALKTAWTAWAWPMYDAATAQRLNRKARLASGEVSPKLSAAHARALHAVYQRQGVGIPMLAEHVYERLGYRTASACQHAIRGTFLDLGLPIRARDEAQRRRAEAAGRNGFGGRGYDRRLSRETVERLWALYDAGHSAQEIARRFYRRLGYESPERLRGAIEYAWKRLGRRMRSNREAELLSRRRMPRQCKAMTSGADGRRPRPCTQRPLNGSDYCLHHDPAHVDEVRARAAKLRALKPRKPRVPWALVRPHLEPLLVPRPDRFGRSLERAGGALARNTGIDPAICSRLLKGREEHITVDRANQLLAPLGLTVDQLVPAAMEEALPLAA